MRADRRLITHTAASSSSRGPSPASAGSSARARTSSSPATTAGPAGRAAATGTRSAGTTSVMWRIVAAVADTARECWWAGLPWDMAGARRPASEPRSSARAAGDEDKGHRLACAPEHPPFPWPVESTAGCAGSRRNKDTIMTDKIKRDARARAARTGESYTQARRAVASQPARPPAPPTSRGRTGCRSRWR